MKKAIIDFLMKKGRWGNHYFPLETLKRWFSKKVEKNGKTVDKAINSLIKEGILLFHKKGKTVSLNPSKIKEINEIL